MVTMGLVEHGREGVAGASLEMLTLARDIGDTVEAVTVGAPSSRVTAQLGAYGVTRLHVVDHPVLRPPGVAAEGGGQEGDEQVGPVAEYAPEAWAESVAQLVARRDPDAVLAAGTARGNEVLAHVAARLDLPLAVNCVEVASGADPAEAWTLTRIRWGGVLLEDAELHASRKLLTIAPHALTATEAGGDAEVASETFTPELDPVLARTRVRERLPHGGGVTLATAAVVVSGGRGVGSAEGFAPLEELAELLGGAVGCSRVATNNGWRPHADQVGQTGARIAPDLYIACGISGATQHWVGCMHAKRILAVNTDPEAPLVTRADYAIIGDVAEVVSALVREVRNRSHARV